jgi:hypothetical protein
MKRILFLIFKTLGALVSYQLMGWLLINSNPAMKIAILNFTLIPTIPTILVGSYLISKEWNKLHVNN